MAAAADICYNNFDENKSLITALNAIKTLKKVIFKEYDFLLKTLSEIKVENAYYINNSTFDSETCYYRKKIIDTEMLNNIKNIEIKIMDECFYKNKTIVFASRLVEGKNPMLLIEAANQIRDILFAHNYKVLICGSGNLEQSLCDYIQQNNLE